WLHTHPGASAEPSLTDLDTFARVFGKCDWAVMFILGRTGQTYARLSFSAGPGGQFLLPVKVDWAAWPNVTSKDGQAPWQQWQEEYEANVQCPTPEVPTNAMPGRDQPDLSNEIGYDPWFGE